MAVTAGLVYAGHNQLTYLVTQDGAAGTTLAIPSTGGVTPDLLTDSLAGPLKNLAKVVADGYKQLPSGVQTQAKSRLLWLSDVYNGGAGFQRTTPTARCVVEGRDGFAFAVDANVDGGGVPTINITAQAAAGAGYLHVQAPSVIGR